MYLGQISFNQLPLKIFQNLCIINFKLRMFFSCRMPFPGGRIIGVGDANHTREGNHHPHMDDSGQWHWIPIFVGVLFLIIMIIVIIYKCLVSNLIFCTDRILKHI